MKFRLFTFIHSSLIGAVLLSSTARADLTLGQAELNQRLVKYQAIKKLEAEFQQTKSFRDMKLKLKSEGKFTLDRAGQKVIWHILKPADLLVTLQGDKVVTKEEGRPDEQVLKISELGKGRLAQSMSMLVSWLEMNPDKLSNQYLVTEMSSGTLRFIPKDKALSPFESIEMKLNKKGLVEHVDISETSGDRLSIDFVNLRSTQ